ncbi:MULTISPECIES: hypothetical protein [unclassified Lentimonas]|uniref:tetratricopeptide repeat protein n=1 Tax=unclassified Lentimonas TaxID=2630993 RepID=UPI0013286DA1|nr:MULTISPECIES: hypothetical protein [unclassified Lentimonas]CAA6693082.1 Unannotated [Lentimonas sp. CC19]CAA6695692.1 Unannotated [Lentimonas sp. CC10]CAA7071535.1 Unannotated [Lentimonas sp. CC11]
MILKLEVFAVMLRFKIRPLKYQLGVTSPISNTGALVFSLCLFGLMLLPCWLKGHGQIHDLVDELSHSIEHSPKNSSLLLKRADLLRKELDYAGAEADLDQVELLDPGNSTVPILRANISLDRGDPLTAEALLNPFLQKQPEHLGGLTLRAKSYELRKDYDRAIKDVQRLIELRSEPNLSDYIWCISLLRESDQPEATIVATYAEVRQAVGDIPSLLFSEAEWCAQVGRRIEASQIYEQIRSEVPNLAFQTWVAEVDLWGDTDPDKTRFACQQVQQVWTSLNPRMQSRNVTLKALNHAKKIEASLPKPLTP